MYYKYNQRNFIAPGLGQFYLGSFIFMCFCVAAGIGLFYSPEEINTVNLVIKLQANSWQHWLGTDYLGRDVLWQIIKGAQISLLTAFAATAIALGCGVLIGASILISPPWLRYSLYYSNTLLQIFPALLIAAILVTIFQASATSVILAIGIAGIPTFVRLTLACSKSLLPNQYILAARTAGLNNWQIFWRHLFPNMLRPLAVQAGIEFIIAILAEAALSYLGFGIQPPNVSWGKMLSEAQSWLVQAPQLAIYPGLAISFLALSILWINDGISEYSNFRRKGTIKL